MAATRMRSVIIGNDLERTTQSVKLAALVSAAILVIEVVAVAIAKSRLNRWPVQDVLFGIQGNYLLFVGLVVAASLGFVGAGVYGYLNNGVVVSLFIGISPVFAYYVGWIIVGGGSHSIGVYVLLGGILGVLGYVIGVIFRQFLSLL